jgi:hypothetical protein
MTESGRVERPDPASLAGGQMVFDSLYIFTFGEAVKITRLDFYMH